MATKTRWAHTGLTPLVEAVGHHGSAARDQLDVAQLLGGDAGHQPVERAQPGPGAEVEALEQLVAERARLPVLAAQELLERGGLGILPLGGG